MVSEPEREKPGATMPIVPRTRGGPAESLPELAGKDGDRGLAVCTGDGHDVFRLRAIKTGRDTRDAAARIDIAHDRDGRLAPRQGLIVFGIGGENGNGALCHRVVDEAAAIRAGPGEGGKQESRLDAP